ncbi:DUF6489 family protein [Paracoccus marinaquae]|uniref:Uncharacterized protein n=1 Tax=Paracoccus marinaquae TaxID=2841926 RepID=A0ABS6ALJ5_9RHOB|nr:DUF6489 family protein [Paracoccus marinaquae]MBU3031472.1 hypothetical protein [Paracoccus marinaquae]
MTVKIVVEMDLTPLEARELMGLPDLQPMQKAVMAKIEQKVLEQAEKLSPEGMLRTWFSGEGTEFLSNMLGGFMSQGRGRGGSAAGKKAEE